MKMETNGKRCAFKPTAVFPSNHFGEGEIDHFCIHLLLGILPKAINQFLNAL